MEYCVRPCLLCLISELRVTSPEPCRSYQAIHTLLLSPVCTWLQCVAHQQVDCGSFLHFLSLSFPQHTQTHFLSIIVLPWLLSGPLSPCVIVPNMPVKRFLKNQVVLVAWFFFYSVHFIFVRSSQPEQMCNLQCIEHPGPQQVLHRWDLKTTD